MTNKIGQVTKKRYQQIVTEARHLVEQQSQIRFSIGDMALEIEPMRPRGGATANASDELYTVEEALGLFARRHRNTRKFSRKVSLGSSALAQGTPTAEGISRSSQRSC